MGSCFCPFACHCEDSHFGDSSHQELVCSYLKWWWLGFCQLLHLVTEQVEPFFLTLYMLQSWKLHGLEEWKKKSCIITCFLGNSKTAAIYFGHGTISINESFQFKKIWSVIIYNSRELHRRLTTFVGIQSKWLVWNIQLSK